MKNKLKNKNLLNISIVTLIALLIFGVLLFSCSKQSTVQNKLNPLFNQLNYSIDEKHTQNNLNSILIRQIHSQEDDSINQKTKTETFELYAFYKKELSKQQKNSLNYDKEILEKYNKVLDELVKNELQKVREKERKNTEKVYEEFKKFAQNPIINFTFLQADKATNYVNNEGIMYDIQEIWSSNVESKSKIVFYKLKRNDLEKKYKDDKTNKFKSDNYQNIFNTYAKSNLKDSYKPIYNKTDFQEISLEEYLENSANAQLELFLKVYKLKHNFVEKYVNTKENKEILKVEANKNELKYYLKLENEKQKANNFKFKYINDNSFLFEIEEANLYNSTSSKNKTTIYYDFINGIRFEFQALA